ncbi:MAG: hypothetical protein CW335_07960 [Clostridiales bacterium]|nr:hypothetical protein [Clostridiales bacterium]
MPHLLQNCINRISTVKIARKTTPVKRKEKIFPTLEKKKRAIDRFYIDFFRWICYPLSEDI